MGLSSLYAQDMFRYMLVAFPVWLVVRFAVLRLGTVKTNFMREIVLGVCALYAVGLLSQTVLPPGYYGFEDGGFYAQPIIRPEPQYNLIPGNSIASYAFGSNERVDEWDQVARLNLLGNVLLFFPLGFLLPLLRRTKLGLLRTMGVGLAASLAIETAQFFFGRSADVDDVILNALGVCLGYLAVALCSRLAQPTADVVSDPMPT